MAYDDSNWSHSWREASQWSPVLTEERVEWTPDIYLIDRNDPPMGGEHGLSNVQQKQLGSRALFLLNAFLAHHKPDGSHELTLADLAPDAGIDESKVAFGPNSTREVEDRIQIAANTFARLEEAVASMEVSIGTPLTALYETLLLAWKYNNTSMNLCLFSKAYNFVDDTVRVTVHKTVAGDNSIDVDTSDPLVVGESYVLAPEGTNECLEVVVSEKLEFDAVTDTWRVLLTAPLDFSVNAELSGGAIAPQALLTKTNWHLQDRHAVTVPGGIFITEPLEALLENNSGLFTIAHADRYAVYYVYYRHSLDEDWKTADREQDGVLGPDGLFLTSYRIPGHALCYLKVVAQAADTVDHMALYVDAIGSKPVYVRTPITRAGENGTQMIIERYGALYDAPFAALEITICPTDGDEATTIELEKPESEEPFIDITEKVSAEYTLEPGKSYAWTARYLTERDYDSQFSAPIIVTGA